MLPAAGTVRSSVEWPIWDSDASFFREHWTVIWSAEMQKFGGGWGRTCQRWKRLEATGNRTISSYCLDALPDQFWLDYESETWNVVNYCNYFILERVESGLIGSRTSHAPCQSVYEPLSLGPIQFDGWWMAGHCLKTCDALHMTRFIDDQWLSWTRLGSTLSTLVPWTLAMEWARSRKPIVVAMKAGMAFHPMEKSMETGK